MPSVYITRLNSAKPLPSFAQKGIPDQMPGEVGDVPIIVETKLFNFARTLWRLVLHCVFGAITIVSDSPIYKNHFKPIQHLPVAFEVPVCTFRFKNLSDSEEAELKAMGLQQDVGNKNHFVGMPGVHQLARIATIGPIGDRLRPGQVTYDGFIAYTYLMKGVLLATTAFKNIHDRGFNTFQHTKDIVEKGATGSLITTNGERVTFVNQADGSYAPTSGILQLIPPTSPVLMSGSYIDVSRLPTTDSNGIFFPFFIGMNTQDKDTAYRVFSKMFSTLLGDTYENDNKVLNMVRAGARELAFHRTGIVLAHIYKVFDIALQVPNAKVHIVLQGTVYAGCSIEGDFRMMMYHKVFSSGPLLKEMQAVNQLLDLATQICGLLNSAEDGNGHRVYNFVPENFLKSRSALSSFRSVSASWFSSSDLYEKVKNLLRQMEFNDIFPVPSQSLISTAVEYMLSGDEALLVSFPAFLGSTVLNDTSRTSYALSMFGPRAPVCNYGDGKGINIAFPGVGRDDTNTVRVNGIRPLAYFPFWTVPLQDAINSWNRMISSGVMHIPRGRKGKKEFTDLHSVVFQIASDPMYSKMYDSIKQMVNEARAAGVQTGKRKRETGEDENKGKKARMEASSFF